MFIIYVGENVMKQGNVVVGKSYDFALRIVGMCRIMREEWREYDLARQLLRSGTSIGANVEEAVGTLRDKSETHPNS